MGTTQTEPRLVAITGAGSGIGRATAIRFARLGALVVALDRNLGAAQETAALIDNQGYRAFALELDVTDAEQWRICVQTILDDHGAVDVLVNNAGIVMGGPFLSLRPDDWTTILDVNLMGVINGSRECGLQMAERGRGHIVNVASAAAFIPMPNLAPYSVSKAAVKMLTECLRVELAPSGIGVSAVYPGFLNTNIGANSVIFDTNHEVVERGKEMMMQFKDIAEKLPLSPLSPDLAARAIVRAARHDLGSVPVRTEAWVAYYLDRFLPKSTRLIARALR